MNTIEAVVLLAAGYMSALFALRTRRRSDGSYASLRTFTLLMVVVVLGAATLGTLAILGVAKFGREVGVYMLLAAVFAAVWVRTVWRAERHVATVARQPTQPPVAASAADVLLTVHRPFVEGPQDLLVGYKIRVDGRAVGEVWSGETLQLRVDPGPHEVRALATWPYRGPVMRVQATRGTSIDLECFPARSRSSPIDLLKPRAWITLRRAPGAGPSPRQPVATDS